MARYKHYLRRNATSRRPSRLVFLDCDSTSENLDSGNVRETFSSAAIATVRRRARGFVRSPATTIMSSPVETWDKIIEQTSNHARTLVISPKPVRVLTLLHQIEHMQQRGWTLDTPVSSARFTAIAWRRDTRTLLFIAHSNLFPTQKLLNGGAAHRVNQMCDTWIEYLKLLDDIDAGDFHLSLGAQALGIYRHRFLQHPILFHGDKRVDEIETRACFGALYQPYFAGVCPAGTYYYLDTNAMYPAMMKNNKYPWRLAGAAGRVSIETLESKLISHDCIATVALSTSDPIYPCRIENRTVFPIGEFVTTLTTPDLRNALVSGSLREIYALAWYDSADLFSLFVRRFWEMRQNFNSHGKPMWGSWAKAMMVSLYGRFGTHVFETRSEGENPFDCDRSDQIASLDDGEVRWYYTLAGKMWSSSRSGLHRESFPAIMAHVSAYGRNRMVHLINLAGRENVFVVLSDGLIVNKAGYEKLQREIMPDELGMLKLKMSGDELEIRSDVEFRLSDHKWLPGVKSDAIEIEDGVFLQHLDPNLTTLARNGDSAEYVKRRCEIHLTRTIHSGEVLSSGQIVPLLVHRPLPSQIHFLRSAS